MAKKRQETKPPKRKTADTGDVHVEDVMDTKVKKKKIKVEAPIQMQTDEEKTMKKKKKQTQEQTEKTSQIKISDSTCGTEGKREPDEEEDLSPEERRVLERKLKKILKKEEKKRLKEEGKTAPKTKPSEPIAPQQALDYLTCWAQNRKEWKFQKTRQTWLLQHIFDSEKIPDEKFPVLLQYVEGLRGGARDTTVQKALALVEESGQAPEDGTVQQRAQRAREVIQLLS